MYNTPKSEIAIDIFWYILDFSFKKYEAIIIVKTGADANIIPASEEVAYCSPNVWNVKKHNGYKIAKGNSFKILCLLKLTGTIFNNTGIDTAIKDVINLCASMSIGFEILSIIFVNKNDKPIITAYSSAAK